MLILTRKKNEEIVILSEGQEISVTFMGMRGDEARLGINAPKNVPVHRREIFEELQKEGQRYINNG